jgi:hypothetical protein
MATYKITLQIGDNNLSATGLTAAQVKEAKAHKPSGSKIKVEKDVDSSN